MKKILIYQNTPAPRRHHHRPSPEDQTTTATTTPTQPSSSRSLSSPPVLGAVDRQVEVLNGPDNLSYNPWVVENPDLEQGLPSARRGASPEREDVPIDEEGALYVGVESWRAGLVVLGWAMVVVTGCIITIIIKLLRFGE
ncbi:Ff.00g075010.m01.CDS01 [Fusarium sp. VM40]|nr:Ff.00g075010.m01.CDS01 [Fusarium sp. VM40]